MDPWTIIGTTSAVLSFAEFAFAIVKTAVDINKSEDGASEDNKRLADVTKNGQELLAQMSEFKISQAQEPTLGPTEDSMLATAEQCRLLGEKILKFLDKMQANKEGSLRSSLKAAAKEVWYKSTVKGLNEQLQSCRTQLNTHLLVVVGSRAGKSFEKLLIMHSAQANDISRLQSLVERLSRNQELELAQIGQIAEIFALPDTILENINRKRILKGLEFDQIEARHEQISQAARDTFGWCISEEAVPRGQGLLDISLKKWLRAGHGIFHISAKPGGGKSTLMKMLEKHSSTHSLLKTWAGDKTLVKANFFVWNAGVPLQKNLQGMIRTLLRQILQQVPELIRTLFQKYWNPRGFYPWMNLEDLKISLEDIESATKHLMTDTDIADHHRFCFFVDGLDEFEDHELKHTEVAEYLQEWVSHNPSGVKFCVSSREEPAFMNTFPAEQRLRLHLLTRPDVEAMVNERLMKHPHFRQYKSADRHSFALNVVSRAEGVFLWVHLLIKNELWDALDEGATADELFALLRRVPEELDEFFVRIINSIRKSNKQEAAMIFAVAIQTDGWFYPLRVFHYSFVEDFIKNPNFSFSIHWTKLERSDSKNISGSEMPRNGRGRLEKRSPSFKELYERVLKNQDVHPAVPFLPRDISDSQRISDGEAWPENAKRIARFKRRLPGLCKGLFEGETNEFLSFAHRSVYDFLKTGPTKGIKAAIDDTSSTASLIIQCITAETKCFDRQTLIPEQQSRYLGRVMGILSSSAVDIRPTFEHLKHLEEALALRQSKLPLDNQRSMFQSYFEQLADYGDVKGNYLSVYAFACFWKLRPYVEWARENYPSWILGDRVRSEIFGAVMLTEPWERRAMITFLLDIFLDPNGPSPTRRKHGNGSPWMTFLKDVLVKQFIVHRDSGFWSTFMAFLRHRADPLVHFRWHWRDESDIGGLDRSQFGVIDVRTDSENDSRGFRFPFGHNTGDLIRFLRAHDGGRADLVDFVRYFAPPNMDEIVAFVQACMEEARRTEDGSTEMDSTRDGLGKLQLMEQP
ncbi:hypothetical protein KVR01_008434 [Diaporthe batatas]|uniref:uncharacterized protein n=1 Tax=Diaporthe batatas TaxID=748121 RepID=UPI001D0557B3|nr:uncharacterized protein KVR01_008434 [Diaporthe batatas]KAG8161447.1 hypothetical protein KVR01_008434 [Diaporthe batatas]